MSTGQYQLAECGVMRLSRRPSLDEHERLRVGLITQDVERLAAVSSDHASATFGLKFEKRFLLAFRGMETRHSSDAHGSAWLPLMERPVR